MFYTPICRLILAYDDDDGVSDKVHHAVQELLALLAGPGAVERFNKLVVINAKNGCFYIPHGTCVNRRELLSLIFNG